MNENLGLTCVDNGAVVIAGGLVDKNWYLYNGVSRPYKSMSYQLQQLVRWRVVYAFGLILMFLLPLSHSDADLQAGELVCRGAIFPHQHDWRMCGGHLPGPSRACADQPRLAATGTLPDQVLYWMSVCDHISVPPLPPDHLHHLCVRALPRLRNVHICAAPGGPIGHTYSQHAVEVDCCVQH